MSSLFCSPDDDDDDEGEHIEFTTIPSSSAGSSELAAFAKKAAAD